MEKTCKLSTLFAYWMQGRIQDFKLGVGAPSGVRREHFWGISCEKSRFYAKKSYFFPILEFARRVRPWDGFTKSEWQQSL